MGSVFISISVAFLALLSTLTGSVALDARYVLKMSSALARSCTKQHSIKHCYIPHTQIAYLFLIGTIEQLLVFLDGEEELQVFIAEFFAQIVLVMGWAQMIRKENVKRMWRDEKTLKEITKERIGCKLIAPCRKVPFLALDKNKE